MNVPDQKKVTKQFDIIHKTDMRHKGRVVRHKSRVTETEGAREVSDKKRLT